MKYYGDADGKGEQRKEEFEVDAEPKDALNHDYLGNTGEQLGGKACSGATGGLKARDKIKIEGDIDDHAYAGHYIELLQVSIGGEERSEDISA